MYVKTSIDGYLLVTISLGFEFPQSNFLCIALILGSKITPHQRLRDYFFGLLNRVNVISLTIIHRDLFVSIVLAKNQVNPLTKRYRIIIKH